MRNPDRQTVFRFKRFDISNSLSAMKVGTDGVLLGAWCGSALEDESYPKRILDIGCGTGLIALMAAQRFPDAHIDAVDIDPSAVAEARFNVIHSPYANRITVEETDILDYNAVEKYDLVVCNPPFFTGTVKAPDRARALARTEGTLSVKSLLRIAVELLNPRGALAIVAPADRDSEIEFEASLAKLYAVRKYSVRTVESRPPRRTLWEFSLAARPSQKSTIIINYTGGGYSSQYIELVKDFYINL